MVAIDTIPSETANRKESLDRWIKRTQEVLAFRSNQGSTFHRLFNLLRTKRLVEIALDNVLRNEGAKTAGVDGVTKKSLLATEARAELMENIHQGLCAKTYRPRPVRRAHVPKSNDEMRPLGIPTIKDRVVQEMLRLVLEPIYEGKFYRHSYGFRPTRSTHHAALRIKDLIGRRGHDYIVEGDIRKCFDRVHHVTLLRILRKTIQDERIVRLVRQMLKAGVMEDGAWHITDEGTPQGGILSPLLSNIYLNELDWFIARKWESLPGAEQQRRRRQNAALPCFIVRYADDFVVTVRGTKEQAEQLKADIAAFLDQALHLELSDEKTMVTRVEAGVDFLGFRIRKFPRATLIVPSQKAKARFRDQVRARIRRGFSENDAAGVVTINRYLIGWGMYYRRVSSSRAFRNLDSFVWGAVWTTTRHFRSGRRHLSPYRHYRSHFIRYRFDLNEKNRWRQGGHYGAWADGARTAAYIVIRLTFLPIRYVDFHPQLNPYVPEERAQLDRKRNLLEFLEEQRRNEPRNNPDYGAEWREIRREVLRRAGHRCERCSRPILGRLAHVHHQQPLKQSHGRRQAHLLENLIALCPKCHSRAEGEHTVDS